MNRMLSKVMILLLLGALALVACTTPEEQVEPVDTPPESATEEGDAGETAPPEEESDAAYPPPEEGEVTAPEGMPAEGQEVTLLVGPTLVDCVGVAPQECLQVRQSAEDEYQLFYDTIQGFDFEEGFEYELRVLVEPVENPPADASAFSYTLVEEVSRTPVDETAGAVQAAATPSLEGQIWTLSSYVNSEGETVEATPDPAVTALFEDGQIAGSDGCNNYFGSYVADGNSLNVTLGGSTMMACPEDISTQASQFQTNLASADSYEISEGMLMVRNVDGEVVLTFSGGEDTPLVGTEWLLTDYNDGTELVSAIEGTTATATFDAEGQVSGSAGCNSFSGGYTVDGNTIDIGPLAATLMICAEPRGIMIQETAMLAALDGAASYAISGNMLELMDADGNVLARFEGQEPFELAGTSWEVTSYNNGQEAVVGVIEGTQITAFFGEDGALTGSGGCNNYMTSYEVDGENISIGPVASTRMLCSEPEGVMEQEDQYLRALETAATFERTADGLQLRTAEDALVALMVPMEAEGGADIVGTVWKWQGTQTPVEEITVANPDQYTIELMDDGTIAVQADCNRAAGGYTLEDSSITITLGPTTLAECAAGSLYDQFLQQLSAAAIYFTQDGELFIDLFADGGTMRFAQ